MSVGPQAGVGGFGGGGYDFKLGPTQNEFGSDTSTAEQAATARDNYGSSNPDWLAAYDANSNLFIELTFLNTMQDATQEVAFIAQRRKNGSWQTVSHNDNTNANLPPTNGAEGKLLQVIDSTGGTRWGSVIFSVADDSSTDFLTATQDSAFAINVKPSQFVEIVTNENGFKVLKFNSQLIADSLAQLNQNVLNIQDNEEQTQENFDAIVARTLSALYGSFSEFNATLDTPITLYSLGYNSLSDSEVQALNLQLITTNMLDDSVLYFSGGEDANVCAASYSLAIITRVSSTRCTAVSSSKQGGVLSSWSSATDNTARWSAAVTSTDINNAIAPCMQLSNGTFNANSNRIINVGNPVSGSDAISLDKLNQDFDALTHPNVLTDVDKLSDSTRSGGYGKDSKIDYYGANETDNWKVIDINMTGHPFMFVHRSASTMRGFLFIHRSVIEQKIGDTYSHGEIGIVINTGQKGQLGKSNQIAQAGSIWNLQGYSVLDTDDANDAGDDVTYTGDDATYSAGNLRNDGSSLAFLAEYRVVNGVTEIQYSSQSEYFALPVLTGGGSFSVIKEFMHLQNNVNSAFTLQLFDTVADIAGANIAALSNSVDDQSAMISDLDERVSDLEGGSNVEELTAVRQAADANGLVESIIMPKSIRTNFDLLQSQAVTKKLGYNAALTNSIVGRVRVVDLADSSKHHTIYYRIDDGVLNVGNRSYTHNFNISISKSVINDQINITLGGSNADVNIEVLAEVLA